jgi:hypothetical protein
MKIGRSVVGVVAALALIVTVGCASVEKATDFKQKGLATSGEQGTHINVKSSGLYVLSIPILTGDIEELGWLPVFMQDTVSLNAVAGRMGKEAGDSGRVLDVVSSRGSAWLGPPFFVLFWKSIQMSGNAVK